MNRILAALCCAAVLAGCARGDRATGLDRDRFVDTIVELRHAAAETRGDTAAYATRRDEILRARRVTEDELRRYVAVHGEDVEHMASVWQEINARLLERQQGIQ